jgi:gliding motility-associated-like protein
LYSCGRSLFLYLNNNNKTRSLRKIFLNIVPFLFLCNIHSFGQNISGVVNMYYSVTSVFADHIVLAGEDLSTLHAGDKVILMQMTGVNVGAINPIDNNLGYNNFGNAGRYEMLAVSSVNNGTKEVSFTVTLDILKYTNGEKLQLVTIYEADYATVTDTLKAAAWNGSKGGVLALVIYKKLTLNADIDVSYKGFNGGEPEADYPGACRAFHDTFFFASTKLLTAGEKGEGIIGVSWANYTKGPGRVVTGGGGGLGYFAGAGGGSHYGVGGQGGIQRAGCSSTLWSANGGLKLEGVNFYGNDRVTMGGGGGASTENTGNPAYRGGNGGGCIILLVDTIDGTGSIRSRGESVPGSPVTAGGGGGGAGGSILLDINEYNSSKNVSVRGGNGGSTVANTGAGGGGGGGIIWYAQGTRPANLIPDTLRGNRGTCSDNTFQGANGGPGGTLNNLDLPLNGFLFNSINGTDTICAGQQPRTITASQPKGGTGTYTYSWLQSTDGNSWVAALGTGNLLSFQPNALTIPTYFTRVVESGAVRDTALMNKVQVYPVISGNTLAIRDTLCNGDSPGTLTGGSPGGGNGSSYGYQWQSSLNQTLWTNRSTNPSLVEGNLTSTTYYRRIVTSAKVCSSTSNIDTLTVLPSISNNSFVRNPTDTAICSGLNGGTIRATLPTGGDGSYTYQWLRSSDNIIFTNAPSGTGQNYNTGTPANIYYYKRIVISGEGNVCTNATSQTFSHRVYPAITGNTIQTDSTRYCAGNTIHTITGNNPSGGNNIFAYQWFSREPGDAWASFMGQTGTNLPATTLTDTTQFYRRVISGDYNACISPSNTIQIDVIPYINNELVSPDSAICEGATPLPFTEPAATGGAGITSGYTYQWQSKLSTAGVWQSAPGTNNLPSYSSGQLTASTQFRRSVTSQICIDNSDVLTITVYAEITGNSIGSAIQYACFNTPEILQGNTIQGGRPGDTRYNWQQSGDGSSGDWVAADGNNATRNYTTIPLTDTMFYRRIVLSGEDDQCIDTSSAALIRINPLPSGDIVSSADSVCSGSELSVGYENFQGNGPWSIALGDVSEWHTEDGITTTSGTISFPVTESGQVRMLDLMDDSLCHADLSGNSGVIDLTVVEVPDADAGTDIQVCGLETVMAAVPSIGEGTWSGSGANFDDPSLYSSAVTSDDYGIYTYYWAERNWQCETTDELEVIFFQPPEVPFAGADQDLDYTFSTMLDAQQALIGYGYWQFIQGTGDFADSTLYNTEVEFPFPVTGDYILRWTLYNGVCEAVSDEVQITVGKVEVYHGFSPNGDGVNEEFFINLSGQVESVLIILDRSGNLVYQSDPAFDRVVWNGENMDEQLMPVGTYFYILRQDGIPDDERGYIELRK